jgi:hypothetical protein
VLRVGLCVPGEEAVLVIDEIGYSMDNLSLHCIISCTLSSCSSRCQFL